MVTARHMARANTPRKCPTREGARFNTAGSRQTAQRRASISRFVSFLGFFFGTKGAPSSIQRVLSLSISLAQTLSLSLSFCAGEER